MTKINIIYCWVEQLDGVKSSGANCWDEMPKLTNEELAVVVSLHSDDERDKIVWKEEASLDCDKKDSSSNEVNELQDDDVIVVSLMNSSSLECSLYVDCVSFMLCSMENDVWSDREGGFVCKVCETGCVSVSDLHDWCKTRDGVCVMMIRVFLLNFGTAFGNDLFTFTQTRLYFHVPYSWLVQLGFAIV